MKDTDLPGGIVLVGDGANLKGFMQLLASHTGLKVRRGTPLGAVKKANLQIKDTDAIDVISILRVAASFNDQKICVEFPEPVKEPEPNPHPSKDDNNEAPEVEDPYKKPKSKPKDGTKKDFGSSVKNLFGKLMEALDDSADDYDDNNN